MAKFLGRFLRPPQKGDTGSSSSEAGTALGPGMLINDRYRIQAEIGRGGMGIVYRAQDLPNNRDVAIKVIDFDRADIHTLVRFSREAEIGQQFDHPHIVSVYETGTVQTGRHQPRPFIVMELVQGTSLEEMRDLTWARILDIGVQICDALEYAHNQGYVYRDLKPENVLVGRNGFRSCAKLTDFGIARPHGVENLPSGHFVEGSLFYLAPELIAGQPADIRSDLYALGATLYQMITGRVPFSDFDRDTVLSQHIESPVRPPGQSRPGVPPGLESIVMRLLQKDPADRFASAKEVGQALERVRLGREGQAVAGNLPQPRITLAGEEEKLARIQQLLESNRLVTLLGDHGSLALAAGTRLAPHFPDGVWYLDLGPVNEPSQVLENVAAVLGVKKDHDRPLAVSLVEHLHEKNLLLLLLHCAHLSTACAQLAETLLPACPDVYILAVSQKPLHIPLETCYP